MGICSIARCTKRTGRDKIKRFSLPNVNSKTKSADIELVKERRRLWIAAIARADLVGKTLDDARVCSDHFISGRPSELWDKTNPDWVPSKNLPGPGKRKASEEQVVERYARRKARQRVEEAHSEAAASLDVNDPPHLCDVGVASLQPPPSPDAGPAALDLSPPHDVDDESDVLVEESMDLSNFPPGQLVQELDFSEEGSKDTNDKCVGTLLSGDDITFAFQSLTEATFSPSSLHAPTASFNNLDVQVQLARLSTENKGLQDRLTKLTAEYKVLEGKLASHAPFTQAKLQNDGDVRFFTGLPTFEMLLAVYEHVREGMPDSFGCALSPFQEMVVALVKLRLDSSLQDLGHRMGVSAGTISRILTKWYTAMDRRLSHLVVWPGREELQATTPVCFREAFGVKVSSIIDCFEVFIDRPSNLYTRAQTWSNYKQHNTIKVLIGITPQGVISFISEPWGGRVSDKYLTQHSQFLSNLLPGDIVLADRGFDIQELVAVQGAKLHIPAFTRGKKQLSADDVHTTRSIANVRIHVERVIGNLRKKYSILRGILPIDFLRSRSGDDRPLICRIIPVCCALTNLCDSVVPFE
ncbi:uncharacterized protein LOC135813447 [Sycon ciliatum]|uniref:uncharacterized protein LOC135813447 n=1 Tax=Sycon ciliatum TaxID=27933 RepID=UPI0031F69A62